ncbi:MAG: hypothetical protein HeimC3_34950 [Candidatus Heimdallarchaeota archaeon LC_3]|nr:MAG: hypothetical protein HeimC3_34950 [Candidatus Heimdallarchaeota archaeon LC_3]
MSEKSNTENYFNEIASCCNVLSTNWPYSSSDMFPGNLSSVISNTQKRIKEWPSTYEQPFVLPSFLNHLNYLVYECDFHNALNPFIIQKLCLIMDFNISPFDIFPLEFYIEFLNIHIRSHTRFGGVFTELSNNLQEFISNSSINSTKELIIPDIIEEEIKRLLCYDDGIFNDTVKFSPNFPMVFLDELDLNPYLKLNNKQSILKNRIHLIGTGSDSYAVMITSQPIPHDLAQLMYDYYSRVYSVIHEEIYDIDYVPYNGIYTLIRDSTLMNFYRSTGKFLDDSFIEEQKILRKNMFR